MILALETRNWIDGLTADRRGAESGERGTGEQWIQIMGFRSSLFAEPSVSRDAFLRPAKSICHRCGTDEHRSQKMWIGSPRRRWTLINWKWKRINRC